jgi:hypothetical protein
MNIHYDEATADAMIMRTLNATKNRRHLLKKQVLITQLVNAADQIDYIERIMFDKYKKYKEVFFTLLGGEWELTGDEDSDSEEDTNLLLNRPNPRNEEEYRAGPELFFIFSPEFINMVYQRYNETEDKEERYPQLNDVLDDIIKDQFNRERLRIFANRTKNEVEQMDVEQMEDD